jgi:hypothetical protein
VQTSINAEENNDVMTRRRCGATVCAGLFIDGIWEMCEVIIPRSSTQTFTVVRIGESK